MGCCVSTSKSTGKQAETSDVKATAGSGESHLLPPPLEEETVKEVLSEIPTPTSKPSSRNVGAKKIHKPSFPEIERDNLSPPPTPPLPPPSSFIKKVEERANETERRTPPPDPSPSPSAVVEEISEVSDMYSFSETVSTTTIGERSTVDDGEVRQRVDRSPAKIPRKRPVNGDSPGKIERGGKSSPARRLNQSPSRRNDSNILKPSQIHYQSAKDISGGGYTRRQRIPASGGGGKRDPGESSGRRSRSPATRGSLGKSPSSRAVRSPARITALDLENGRKTEEAREEGNWPTNESLENPLVSMECFIFL